MLGPSPQQTLRRRTPYRFSPLHIPGCVLWLDADREVYNDAGVTLATDGQTVQQWNDLSGNGNHATQIPGSAQPLKIDSIVAGRPVIRFDGIDDGLLTSSAPFGTLSPGTPLTIVAVVSRGAGLGSMRYIAATGVINEIQYWLGINAVQVHEAEEGRIGIADNVSGSASSVTGVFDICVGLYTPTTVQSVVNGVAATPTALDATVLGATPAARTWSMGQQSGDGYFSNVDLAVVLLFNRYLTDSERHRLERWLSRRYGIVVA